MGTETRIGIAVGLLIVIVASVYFFRGRDRSGEDLLIADSSSTEPPRVPPPNATKPRNTKDAVTPKPSGRQAPRRGVDRGYDTAKKQRPETSAARPRTERQTNQFASNRPPRLTQRSSRPGVDPRILPVASPSAAQDDAPSGPTPLQSGPSSELIEATESRLGEHPSVVDSTPQSDSHSPGPSGEEKPLEASDAIERINVLLRANGLAVVGDQEAPKVEVQATPLARAPEPKPNRLMREPARTVPGKPAADSPAGETPPASTPRPAPSANQWPKEHRVEAGDTLSQICDRYYGTSRLVSHLIQANPEYKDPSRLRIGAMLEIPAPPASNATPDAVQAARANPTNVAPGRAYQVQSGDTFYTIARAKLGTSTRWKELFELNRDLVKNDPKRLRVGMVLELPK